MLEYFQSLFRRSNLGVFRENEGKIQEGGCANELLFCKVAGWHLATS